MAPSELPIFAQHFVFGPLGDDGKCVVKDLRPRQTYFQLGEKSAFYLSCSTDIALAKTCESPTSRGSIRDARRRPRRLPRVGQTRGLLEPTDAGAAACSRPLATAPCPGKPTRPASPAAAPTSGGRAKPRGQSILACAKACSIPTGCLVGGNRGYGSSGLAASW